MNTCVTATELVGQGKASDCGLWPVPLCVILTGMQYVRHVSVGDNHITQLIK